MELRQLQYFQAAATINNITRAAKLIHVSQPSVTQAIHKLEAELGVKLFDRRQKKLSLTPEGQVFLRYTEDILAKVQDSILEMNDHNSGRKGSIRVGVTPMMGAALIPSAYGRFRELLPDVDIFIKEEGTLSIVGQLERGELDMGIMIVSDLPSGLRSIVIRHGRILVCLPKGHRLADMAAIPFSALRDEPFILFGEDTYSRHLILKECERFHFKPIIAFSSSQIGTVTGLVGRGAGISFFFEDIELVQDSVVARPLEEPLMLTVGIAWNPKRYLSKAAKAFIETFRTDEIKADPFGSAI
jgi:DNA-binding transcriptional LysR family regulator